MATNLLSTDARPANPVPAPRVSAGPHSLAYAASSATRRAFLGTLTAIPAAAVASNSLAAVPCGGAAQVSPALVQAILYQRRASAFAHHYANTVHTPAYDAWQADVSRIPHVTTGKSFASVMGEQVALSTSNEGAVATSRRVLGEHRCRQAAVRSG